MSNKMRFGRWLALGGLALLAACPAAAREVQGRLSTTDDKTCDGTIRWKGVAKVYIVSKNNIDLEVPPNKVRAIAVPEPTELRAAIRDVQEGRLPRAIAALSKIVDDYAMLQWDLSAARWLAEAHLKDGKPDVAARACEKVIADHPDAGVEGELAPVYWRALLAAGRSSKLNELLDKAAASEQPETQARALTLRGEILRKQGDLKAALRDGYLRAIVLYPKNVTARAEALYRAQSAFDELGQISYAEKTRRQLLTEYPNSEGAQKLRAGERS
jgi:TolA-binding protein